MTELAAGVPDGRQAAVAGTERPATALPGASDQYRDGSADPPANRPRPRPRPASEERRETGPEPAPAGATYPTDPGSPASPAVTDSPGADPGASAGEAGTTAPSRGNALDALRQALLEPEQMLADYPIRVDEDTLREVADDPSGLEHIQAGLTTRIAGVTDHPTRCRLLGLRAVVNRLLGALREALEDGEQALRHAQATGSARRIAVASTRLARVLQWRGDFDAADELYQRVLDSAIPDRLRASIHYHFGTSCYDQGRFLEAMQHFETALGLQHTQTAQLVTATERAFNAISRHAGAKGFGPFPRSRAEVLQETPSPRLRFHEVFQRYGYTDRDGEVVIPPTYDKAYPFAGGVAWVQPEGTTSWTLIDREGQTLISGTDYEYVGPFHEGLAWVVSDPVIGWFAIDTRGIVVVPPAGYTNARPFHNGLAAVERNGRWGAVDPDGREVIPMEYDAFRTAASDATYLTGFTSEGLAVVERDGLLGVINRAGDTVIPITFQQIEVNPVGYLVMPPLKQPDYSDVFRSTVDLDDGWGAMDRAGELVVPTVHPNRAAVLEELEKLLRDAHPIL